jgi:hypothetical protein
MEKRIERSAKALAEAIQVLDGLTSECLALDKHIRNLELAQPDRVSAITVAETDCYSARCSGRGLENAEQILTAAVKACADGRRDLVEATARRRMLDHEMVAARHSVTRLRCAYLEDLADHVIAPMRTDRKMQECMGLLFAVAYAGAQYAGSNFHDAWTMTLGGMFQPPHEHDRDDWLARLAAQYPLAAPPSRVAA